MRSAEGIYKSLPHKRTHLHSQKGSGFPDACLFGQVQCCPHKEKGDQSDRFKRKLIDYCKTDFPSPFDSRHFLSSRLQSDTYASHHEHCAVLLV
ncbi:uncharacterized [Tachysurus ichikawai]